MPRLEGKVAVITGAASGIGRATSELFHAEGCSIICGDIHGQQHGLAKELGARALGADADVTKAADIRAMCELAEEKFGGLDILFSNAGAGVQQHFIVDDNEATIDVMLSTNTRAAWLGIKYAVPLMIRRGGGSIIHTASTAAIMAYPGMAAYAASKAGIIGLTYAAAREYGSHNIRVNTICPGPTDTPLRTRVLESSGRTAEYNPATDTTALRRLARPEEIAYSALFLASDEASYVTGVVLPVDGGQSL